MRSEDKQCAFVRWTWYETAKTHLNDEERLTLYETIFAYQFEDKDPGADLPPMVAMLFDIIRPTLTSDRDKMRHRREVAQQNGVLGGRPRTNKNLQEMSKPSWINENPVGYSGLPIYNIQDANTIAKDNVSVQGSEINTEDTQTKFLVTVEFFLMGVEDPIEEGRLFWSYYDARGWVTGDGQKIKNIVALAKTWHPKTLLAAAAKRRQPLRSLFKLLEMPDFSLFERLLAVEIDRSTSVVSLFVRTLEDAQYVDDRHRVCLSKWVKSADGRGENYVLDYHYPEAVE